MSLAVYLMGLTVCLCKAVLAAYTDEFLQAFRNLGLDPWAGMEMDNMPHYAMDCIAHPLLAPSSCTE